MFRLVASLLLLSAFAVAEDASAPKPAQMMEPAHKVEQPTAYSMHQPAINNDDAAKALPAAAVPGAPGGAAVSSPTHRQGRFFLPFNGFANGLTGNPSLSSVLTLNLNNLALVGLFLIGVFILLPSIIGFLTGLSGTGAPFAAKALRTDDQPSYSWGMMQMLENVLNKNNIDVRVCMERATCHVAKSTFSNSRSGTPTALESALNFAITSSYGQNLLTSYRLKEATDRGKNGEDCDQFYNRCPYSLGNLSKLISTYYSAAPVFSSFANANMTSPF